MAIGQSPVAPSPAAQAPGPFGMADLTARSLINAAARSPRAVGNAHPSVTTVRHAYERLPAAARAAAVTAAFAWAKGYVSSPAFATAYAAARQQAKPAGVAAGPSVDEELKKKVDDERASLEESRKSLALLPAADRAVALKALNEAEDRLRDPELLNAWRADFQSRHDADTQGTAQAAAEWNAIYPSDARAFVRQELERFLADSANVDFSIPITPIRTGGVIVGFVGPLVETVGSWIEAECLLAGKDMVLAGRAATESWLKELPK
jgi:hypothetical protein